jgi:hypothetical protein
VQYREWDVALVMRSTMRAKSLKDGLRQALLELWRLYTAFNSEPLGRIERSFSYLERYEHRWICLCRFQINSATLKRQGLRRKGYNRISECFSHFFFPCHKLFS